MYYRYCCKKQLQKAIQVTVKDATTCAASNGVQILSPAPLRLSLCMDIVQVKIDKPSVA